MRSLTSKNCGLLLALLASACGAAEDDAMPGNSAEAYVAGLPDNCVYDDGYICAAEVADETSFIEEVDSTGMLGGAALQAWNTAWGDFQQLVDLSEEQKKLKHYRIGFSRDADNFIVVFRPLMLPYMENGKPAGISRGTIGPGVKYWIDRQSFAITNRLFQK